MSHFSEITLMSQRGKHSPSFLMSFKKKAAVSHIFPWANSQSRPVPTTRWRTWGLSTSTNLMWHKQETKITFFWRKYFWAQIVPRSRALGNFQARIRKCHEFSLNWWMNFRHRNKHLWVEAAKQHITLFGFCLNFLHTY